jgi:hypothetical protein
MSIAIIKNILLDINHIAIIIINGKLRKTIKLNITLILRNNIRKYNLIVLVKLNIVIFDDIQIDSKTHFFSNTIIYFEYEKNIFNIIAKNNNTKNT